MYRSVQPTLLGALLATFAAAGCAREQGYRTTTAGAEMPPPGYQTEQYERIPTERGMEQRQAYPQRAPGYAEEPMPGQQGAYRPPQATPPAPPAGAQEPMAPNDERLHAEVHRALDRAPSLDATRIQVVVQGGAVYLSGEVPTADQRRLAHDVAHTVEGVNNVYTRDLRVR